MDRIERQAWGPLILVARKAAGLSQDELADAANTTRRTIGSIERGDSVAQREVLDRIIGVLGLQPTPNTAADITAFLAMIEPLLQRIELAERQRLMPEIVRMLSEAIAPLKATVTQLHPEVSEVEDNIEDLYDEPSAAHPVPRNDVEGDVDPDLQL